MQVLIHVRACGVNPVETYIRSGSYARKPTLPYTPGSDVAGVVDAVGEGVTAVKSSHGALPKRSQRRSTHQVIVCVFQAGDRVFTTATESGGYAEYAVAVDDCVHKLPDALDFTQGAAIGIPYFTAYRALVHNHWKKYRAWHTTGTAVFAHEEATEGWGVNVIVEMLSNVNLSKDLQLLAHGGRVVGSRGSIEINPRDTMAKESSIVGVALFFSTPEEKKECASLLFAGMEAGWLQPVVGPQYPLEKAAQAHHDIMESPGAAGKIVLTM
ncbi:hypothetical protein GOODEAATRI_016726 [Goodea atripinnis]|uniref:Enoyl reductase (ER) domain-containing protein n=1 Tax=Goodea atripinnis TaxID=208336 RepID=A0ABV0NV47_9TELE